MNIKVGHCYKFQLGEDQSIAFAVLYGFERGKNKQVYSVMILNKGNNFEFPIEESTFDKWVMEGRIQQISAEEALVYAIGTD